MQLRLESEDQAVPVQMCQQYSILWSDLTLVEIEHGRRSHILSGAVQGAKYFPSSLVMDYIYKFHVRSGGSLSPNRCFYSKQPFTGWTCQAHTQLFFLIQTCPFLRVVDNQGQRAQCDFLFNLELGAGEEDIDLQLSQEHLYKK